MTRAAGSPFTGVLAVRVAYFAGGAAFYAGITNIVEHPLVALTTLMAAFGFVLLARVTEYASAVRNSNHTREND